MEDDLQKSVLGTDVELEGLSELTAFIETEEPAQSRSAQGEERGIWPLMRVRRKRKQHGSNKQLWRLLKERDER